MVQHVDEESKIQNETQNEGTNATSNFQETYEDREKNINNVQNVRSRTNSNAQRPVFRLNLENISGVENQ